MASQQQLFESSRSAASRMKPLNRLFRPPTITNSFSFRKIYHSATIMTMLFVLVLTSFALLKSSSINCQTYDKPTNCNHQNQQQARQQRQYSSNGGSRAAHRQQQQQQQEQQHIVRSAPQLLPAADGLSINAEQEEFSLALGLAQGQQGANSNYTLLPSASQSNEVSLPTSANQQQQSGPALPAPPPAMETTTSSSNNLAGLPVTTPALPFDPISSSVVLQPPAATTSSIRGQQSSVLNKATANASSSSSSSSVSNENLPQPTMTSEQPKQQTRQRMDEQQVDSSQYNNHDNLFPSYSGRQQQQQHLMGSSSSSSGQAQPVSSSPSSISIITPLIGPPTLHQQQQQAMHTSTLTTSIVGAGDAQQSSAIMKPLFVMGNPLSERDYNNNLAAYDGQQQQAVGSDLPLQTPATVATSSSSSSSKAAKGLIGNSDSTQLEQHQQPQVDFGQSQRATNSVLSPKVDLQPTEGSSLNSSTGGVSGPPAPVYYSDGHLVPQANEAVAQVGGTSNSSSGSGGQQMPSPRLFQAPNSGAVLGNNPRRPSLPPPVNQANAASGFRSPMSPSGPLVGGGGGAGAGNSGGQVMLQAPVNSLMLSGGQPNFYQTSPPYGNTNGLQQQQQSIMGYNKQAFVLSQQPSPLAVGGGNQQAQAVVVQQQQQQQPQVPTPSPGTAPGSIGYSGRRPVNITRVEHISAECSNDLIRAVIVFNGTFKGIIYSSGYVNDPTCLYVNGTGSTRYEFSIRLNQCGTLGRQELHQPTIPGEARRRDQVMWNTLSIQYNSIIEQEWDEHFRVSCEYGSDFWKTVSFSPFNVETNTGSPVVFTINPPQCQMDVLLGHGMGPKIVDGPVTVGDPLTLLIHMKSEKAGYDILVKNCVAHNGGKQRMQLIDSNGCVVNERFISPFRGTYNDNDLRHVTLYAYLKAFRFTGSPVLYLECEIHMCQSACPPQMCYWRRLSKRSVDDFDYEYTKNSSSKATNGDDDDEPPLISDSLNLFKALQVRQESEKPRQAQHLREVYAEDDEAALVCYRHTEVFIFLITMGSLLLLVITIAITCCLRIRKLTRSHFSHTRLALSSSLSPSLLSVSDVISNAGSTIIANKTTSATATTGSCPNWQQHQQMGGTLKFGANLHQHQSRRQVAQPNSPSNHFHGGAKSFHAFQAHESKN